MALTENQKRLYNIHLSTYKRRQNQPYKFRENFDDFERDYPEKTTQLMKLDNLFKNYPDINVRLFFDAPYEIYEDRDYFELGFYIRQSAIKCYQLFLKELDIRSPDSESQLVFMGESLKFIRDYCIQHKINLMQYLSHREGIPYAWQIHLITYKISYYVIIGFNYFGIMIYDLMKELPSDEQTMFLGNLLENYVSYKDRLDNSKKAKPFIVNGLKLINDYLNMNNNLNSENKCVNIG